MVEIVTNGNAPVEIVEPFGVGPIALGITIRQIPAECLEAKARAEVEAVVWKNVGRWNAAGCGSE